MGYVRLNAVHLETTQPFFTEHRHDVRLVHDHLDPYVDADPLGMVADQQWCVLRLPISSLGHTITNPLFVTPKYDPEFVMNYIGLGTNQGFYYLAQVAADAVYFLIIYAAILLGVGMLEHGA